MISTVPARGAQFLWLTKLISCATHNKFGLMALMAIAMAAAVRCVIANDPQLLLKIFFSVV
jgi:hypothetical protein